MIEALGEAFDAGWRVRLVCSDEGATMAGRRTGPMPALRRVALETAKLGLSSASTK